MDPITVGFEKVLKHAEQKLQRNPKAGLEDHLDLFKKFLALEDQRLKMQHRYSLEGRKICHQRAKLVDLLIEHMYTIARAEYEEKNPKDNPRCAVMAVGGYGRGELNFHSDIDIMFLFPDKVGEFGKFLVNKILYLLWDLGMTVGHSTRTIAEALTICSTDLVSRTALFEGRFLIGDESLFHHFNDKLEEKFAKVPRVVQSYIFHKLQERDERHVKFGASMYLQEPNVKESIGGIRDLHNVLWVLRLKYGSGNLKQAVSHQLLTEQETQQLEKSFDFLLAVRNELHLCSGKKMDILTRPYQPKIAKVFGLKDQPERTAAELLMKKYYLHVRTIAFLSAAVLSKLKEPVSLAERSLRFLKRRDLGYGLVDIDGTMYLEHRDPNGFRKNPLLMLRIFSIAQQQGLKIQDDLKAVLRNNLHLVEKKFQASPEAAKIFREILRRKGRVGPTLRTMHEIGFLGKYIPEFGKITCHVQDSDYHRYTTDEHSLKAIENVDYLYSSTYQGNVTIKEVASELPHPELLYYAFILHDVGKLDPEDHVSLGLVMAKKSLKRMAYSAEDTEKILFLIREHLIMSHLAQRRDLDDNTTIMDFSVVVKTLENLQGLLLLSYADANAVAPGIWTPWKEALTVELYNKTRDWLTGKAAPLQNTPEMLKEIKNKVSAELKGKVSAAAIENHLNLMPARYSIFTPVPLIARHVWLAEGLRGKPFLTDWGADSGNETMREVTVCTRDRLGLFTLLAGCFTLHDINITGAQISTRRDGLVMDTFRVSNLNASLPLEKRILERFSHSLEKSLEGTLDLDEAVQRHENQIRSKLVVPKKIPPVVLLDNRISDSKTVVEVQALDRLGLLFHISKVLARLDIDISAAKISTERALAYDVFYITDKTGEKITAEAAQNKIIQTLQRELAG